MITITEQKNGTWLVTDRHYDSGVFSSLEYALEYAKQIKEWRLKNGIK